MPTPTNPGLALLGATGSIGNSALKLLRDHPGLLPLRLLTTHQRVPELLLQIRQCKPARAYVTGRSVTRAEVDEAARSGCRLGDDREELLEALADPELSHVLLGITGAAGLEYGLRALRCGKRLAIANKEPLVIAGHLFHETARQHGGTILPVDSEHSAIFQCLQGERHAEIEKIILTTSGGPFHASERSSIASATREQALKHPTWKMGEKITIDSATMINKALEMLEAKWLFDIDLSRIEVTVHLQSIVHSMVQFCDGSVMAQCGVTDMQFPILYALSHPARWPSKLPRLDFQSPSTWTFEKVNPVLNRALELAREVADRDDAPVAMNAANEVFVEAFLEGRAGLLQCYDVIEHVLTQMEPRDKGLLNLEEIQAVDGDARLKARAYLKKNYNPEKS